MRTAILEKTMLQMPRCFTSQQFNATAIKNGYPKNLIKHKGLASFIGIYATNDSRFSKTWTKRDFLLQPTIEPIQRKDMLTDEQMISHLKSKGYKIMKPINEWLEC